jgi:hypothetical protein
MHSSLLVNALEETAHQSDIELIEHWNLTDRHITSVVLAMTTDLDESSPAERLYGESLANAFAVICSIATPCGATCRPPSEEVCQAIVSSACLIVSGPT